MKFRILIPALTMWLLVAFLGACDNGNATNKEEPEDTVWTWEMCDSIGWDTSSIYFHSCDTLLWERFSADCEWEDSSGGESYARSDALRMGQVTFRGIKKMSPLIGRVHWLGRIYIEYSDSIEELPSEIWEVGRLFTLVLEGMASLKALPEVRDTSYVQNLFMARTNPTLPKSLGKVALTTFDWWSKIPFAFPEEVRWIKTLKLLSLGSDGIDTIPPWIVELDSLKMLGLSGCPIRNLPEYLIQMHSLTWIDFDWSEVTEIPEFMCSRPDLTLRFTFSKVCQIQNFPSCMESTRDSLIKNQECN